MELEQLCVQVSKEHFLQRSWSWELETRSLGVQLDPFGQSLRLLKVKVLRQTPAQVLGYSDLH